MVVEGAECVASARRLIAAGFHPVSFESAGASNFPRTIKVVWEHQTIRQKGWKTGGKPCASGRIKNPSLTRCGRC
jgi:hypothetical protein